MDKIIIIAYALVLLAIVAGIGALVAAIVVDIIDEHREKK